MAKCQSPFSAKAQAALAYVTSQKAKEKEEEEKVTMTMEQLALEEAKKRASHKPIDQWPPGTVPPAILEAAKKKYGRLPDGVLPVDARLPEMHRLFEACFRELHGISYCYPTISLAHAFMRQVPLDEIPLMRFFLTDFITIAPDLGAGVKRSFMSAEREQELQGRLSVAKIQAIKEKFVQANPQTPQEAHGATQVICEPAAVAPPKLPKDGLNGVIAGLGAALYENGSVRHAKLMVRWLIEHMFAVLPPRPPDKAVIEYCVHYSKARATGFWLLMRWCTSEDGYKRYGVPPEPCQAFTYPLFD